jgi:uncharacterized protein YlxW (UPF0749 family)
MTASSASASDAPQARHYDDLLTQVLAAAVDPDYRVATERRRGTPPGGRTTLVVALAAFGVLIGVSALQTEQDRPTQLAERAQLVDQIHVRQDRLASLHSSLTSLQEGVSTVSSRLAGDVTVEQQLDEQLTQLSSLAGTSAVTGPGVTITVDDAQGSGSGLGGVVRDADLQLLANGLWEAGAEAVSIGGQRLTGLSSIRFAGRAITVNYRSLTPPYVVEAIGDPDTLAAKLLQTQAGGVWISLQANYGIEFDVQSSSTLTLPAQPVGQLRYAREAGAHR